MAQLQEPVKRPETLAANQAVSAAQAAQEAAGYAEDRAQLAVQAVDDRDVAAAREHAEQAVHFAARTRVWLDESRRHTEVARGLVRDPDASEAYQRALSARWYAGKARERAVQAAHRAQAAVQSAPGQADIDRDRDPESTSSPSDPPEAPETPPPVVAKPAPSPAPVPAPKDHLGLGETLLPEQGLVSPNGVYRLVMQADGNLVLLADGQPQWASGTKDNPGATATMQQSDGNLVITRPDGQPIWGAGTEGSGADKLAMQDDGNVVIYGPTGPKWSIRDQPKSEDGKAKRFAKGALGLGAEVSGYNDGKKCVVTHDKTDCAMAAAGFLPFGKAFKAVNVAVDAAKLARAGKAVEAANTGLRLAEASSSAFRAADNVGDFTVSAKHLPGAGGRWNKWAEGVDINGTIADALRSDAASFLPNATGAPGSFIVRTNVGVIGTKGETYVKAVISNDGRIITAYPVK